MENACELHTVLLAEYGGLACFLLFACRLSLRRHHSRMSLQVSIRQTLVLQLECVVENACELNTVLLAEYGGLACFLLFACRLSLRRHHSRMSLQVSIRQTLVLQLECVVENACELHTVLLAEYGGLACFLLFACRLSLRRHHSRMSLQVSIRQTLVLQLECVVENACELNTVLLAEYGGLACILLFACRLSLRRHHSRMSLQVSIRQTLVLQLECVVENACELHTVLLAEYGGLACFLLFACRLSLRRHHSRMSLQVSIRQTLVLQLECVVENACELHTVLLAEYGGLACVLLFACSLLPVARHAWKHLEFFKFSCTPLP